MPQPGIEPGRPNWARDCKSRLYTNSSTGAQKPDVGTVTPLKVAVAVPLAAPNRLRAMPPPPAFWAVLFETVTLLTVRLDMVPFPAQFVPKPITDLYAGNRPSVTTPCLSV